MNGKRLIGRGLSLVIVIGMLLVSVGAHTAYISATGIIDTVKLKFVKSVSSIKAGKSTTFKVEVEGTDEPVSFAVWSSDNKKRATISSDGKFKAIKTGTVYVQASVGDVMEQVKVKIKPKHIIAIDAGHQAKGDSSTEPIGPGSSTKKAKVAGGTSGVSTKVPEYKLTLTVAKKLKKELVNRGYKVVMIRTSNDVNISNKERALKANESSDICIRLHADGIGNSSVSGASALYPSSKNKFIPNLSLACKKLSGCVLEAMCKSTGAKNRGLSARDDLTGTNWSTIPVALLEMGFMTNPTEDRNMQDKDYQKMIVQGIANGIDKYYKK